MIRPASRTARRQRGLAAVETAITMPFLMFLLLVFAEFGNAIMQYNEITKSSRDAVRHLAGRALDGQTGQIEIDPNLETETKNLAVYGNTGGNGAPIVEGLSVSQVSVTQLDGAHVQVDVDFPYAPITGFTELPTFGIGDPIPMTITLRTGTAMRAL